MRSLRRTPVYAMTVVITLALGLAAVGAMFAVVGALKALRAFGPMDFPRLAELAIGPWSGVSWYWSRCWVRCSGRPFWPGSIGSAP